MRITGLGGPAGGVTVNVGTLHGGTRPNVVPADAVLELDLRASTTAAMAAAEDAIRAVVAAPAVPDVTMELELGRRFPPMERLPSTDALLARVAAVGAALGLEVGAVATGGASDANVIADAGGAGARRAGADRRRHARGRTSTWTWPRSPTGWRCWPARSWS